MQFTWTKTFRKILRPNNFPSTAMSQLSITFCSSTILPIKTARFFGVGGEEKFTEYKGVPLGRRPLSP